GPRNPLPLGGPIGIVMQTISESYKLDPYEGMSPNEKAALYIVEKTDNQDLVIETVLDIAKREKIGGKEDTEIYHELNSLMERTMQCRMDEKWKIISIFDSSLQISEKQTFIEKKLAEFRFNTTLTNYNEAVKAYNTFPKGSISVLRSTFESLVDDIIESAGEPLNGDLRAKLGQLKKLGILKEIKNDNEVEYSYKIFGLLSHYGAHKELITEEVANFLFTSTIAFLWFLINRYEK
ncbi:MAG: hypothetical protein KAT65_27920, partial [Methanophagales archaeon]|nr:hypothetical protein [Methanophagales archaeon]